jgi:hypothetical protein
VLPYAGSNASIHPCVESQRVIIPSRAELAIRTGFRGKLDYELISC